MRLVCVEWIDARFLDGWECRDAPDSWDVIHCVTTGMLVAEKGDSIKVCLHRNDEQQAGCMAIPKCCIKRIRKLTIDCQDK